jgi:hypothetical protein
MASSGIRIGAWNYLQRKHISPIHNEFGEVIAASFEKVNFKKSVCYLKRPFKVVKVEIQISSTYELHGDGQHGNLLFALF